MLRIRRAEESDYPEIANLISEIFGKEMRRGEKDFYFVAEKKGRIAGFAHITFRGRFAILRGLGVKERERGKGIGSALFEKAIEFCEKERYEEILLKVSALNPALLLYLRKGFFLKRARNVYMLSRRKHN